MKKLFVTSSFLISLICLTSQSLALPACPSSHPFDNCYGSYTYASGASYEGEWKDNYGHGQGTYNDGKGYKYAGEYKKSKRTGMGIETWTKGKSAGHKYVGEFKNDKRNGQGTYTYPNGDEYVGGWKDGNKHGQGKYTYANGKVEEGIFKNDEFMYAKKPTSTSNPKIEEYKSFCSEIGFTTGTEKFGECVVEAMKKG